jgi:arginine:ornithine antiporter/lysine permease
MLTSMVMGSMLASGIFTLPRSFAQATGPLGLLIVWVVAGSGTLMLAFVMQRRAERWPDLDAGVFAYAKAGFGAYAGFLSALGYWTGACLLNVTYFVLIKGTLGAVVPAFGDGNTPQAVLASSLLLWAIHALILKGVKGAATVNLVVTAAKVVTVLLAVAILVAGFEIDTFTAGFWGGGTYGWAAIPGQVQSAMILAVYVFLGIEGASVYSRYARNRADVGRATLLGLAGVSALFFLVTLLPYGVVPRAELAQLRNPSLAGVLEAVVGRWGAWFVGVGLIMSLAGAFLSRSLLSAEVLWAAAKAETVPRVFARENARRVPVAALWLSSGLVQGFLILTLFAEEAYSLALRLTSTMILLPYLLVAAFALELWWLEGGGRRAGAEAVLATVYAAFLLWAAGPNLLLASTLIYGPGTVLFVLARRELGQHPFEPTEAVVFGALLFGAIFAMHGLVTGAIRL